MLATSSIDIARVSTSVTCWPWTQSDGHEKGTVTACCHRCRRGLVDEAFNRITLKAGSEAAFSL